MIAKWILSLAAAGMLFVAPCQAKDSVIVDMLPNALNFLPPPPEENSASFARDKAIYEQTRSFMGSERWDLATFDADIDNNAVAWFKDSFGLALNKANAPSSYALLYMLFMNLAQVDSSAKEHYMRTRPFVYYNAFGQTCAPGDEERLSKNGSYPSGHTSRGWAMALILAEISPERQDAILKRGYEIGQSRVICGFHWQSDVDAGRLTAAATVARLRNVPEFNELLIKAREEVTQLRKKAK